MIPTDDLFDDSGDTAVMPPIAAVPPAVGVPPVAPASVAPVSGGGIADHIKQLLPSLAATLMGGLAMKSGPYGKGADAINFAVGLLHGKQMAEDRARQEQRDTFNQGVAQDALEERKQARADRHSQTAAAFMQTAHKNAADWYGESPAEYAAYIKAMDEAGVKAGLFAPGTLVTAAPFPQNVLDKKKKKAASDKLAAIQKLYGPQFNSPEIQGSTVEFDGQMVKVSDLGALSDLFAKNATGAPVLPTPKNEGGSDFERYLRDVYMPEKGIKGRPPTRQEALEARKEWGASDDRATDPLLNEMRAMRIEQMRRQQNVPDLSPVQFNMANKLADDFTRDSKDFVQRAQSYGTVLASAKDPSAAGDLSLIFAYMKMLDPGSVVREGEFATAQNAASVPDRIRNVYNKAISGERLGAGQRGDFVARAKGIYGSAKQRQDAIVQTYTTRAQRAKLPPEMVVMDFGAGVEGPAPGAPPPAAATPTIGERRTIDGHLGEWDGKGWKAVKP
jgi:Arc/MetJ-type ribon-helix-helix transcriptional regulator